MKLLPLALLLPMLSLAADIQFAWDPSPSNPSNYVFFAHTNTLTEQTVTNAAVKVNVGTNTQVWLADLGPGMWSFAVSAQKSNIYSSPIILHHEVPRPPERFRTVTAQYSGVITGPFTNFGFFRLKIE